MPMNKVEVIICGKRFLLQTQDSPEYIQRMAKSIDQKFQELFDDDPKMNLFDASVLVTMEILDQSVRSEKNSDNIRAQIKAYAEEANKLRAQVEKLNKQLQQEKLMIEKLQTEADILKLRNQLDKQSTQENTDKQECLI